MKRIISKGMHHMMAPSASKEETSPAAPEQHQQVVTVEDARRKKIEESLSSLESYRARCSEMLEAARRRRVKSDLELRCLEFMEMELSQVISFVTALQHDHAPHPEAIVMSWSYSYTLPDDLDKADPQQLHTLLRRAKWCIRYKQRHPYRLRSAVERSYRLAEHHDKYEYRLSATFGYRVFLHWILHFHFCRGKTLLLYIYLIMFPYGYMFDKDRLVTKWSFEGISNVGEERLINSCFSNLVDYGTITRAAANSRRNNPDEAETTWQLNVSHHEYHQSLANASAEIGFAFTSATLNILAQASATDHGNEARRLAFHQDVPSIPRLLQQVDLSQTRSLAVSGDVSRVPVNKFVNLVLLDVEGWKNFEDEDLLHVCRSKMFFLKYLSIRRTRVSKLPPEIKELCNLEILDASCTLVTELPIEVFVATRLRRLDIRGTPIRQLTLPKKILGLQESLSALLLGSEETINTVETTVTRPPHDIWRFRNLERLATIDLSEQPASFIINSLGDLECLRVLAITWSFHQSSDRDYCEALLSSIEQWCNLESLTIHCGLGCSMEFLGPLSQPPRKLETFKVTAGRFSGVPQWFDKLRFLSSVQITVCKLEAHDLQILGGLRELKHLILSLDFIPREAIVIRGGIFVFHKLKKFYIDCPVPWLTFESEAMPELTYLQLNFCASPTSLISFPLLGMSKLRRLQKVALWYNVRYANSSSVKMTVEAVRKEVAKVVSLFINGIEQDDVQGTPSDIHLI